MPAHHSQTMTDHPDFSIARATLHDLDELASLFDGYRVFYGMPSDPIVAHEFLHARLAADESVIFLARDGQQCALGFTQLYPCFSSVAARRVWILNDLFVADAARNRGVGRALLERARAHARQTGARRLVLETAQTNVGAQALYESLGYLRQGESYAYSLELL